MRLRYFVLVTLIVGVTSAEGRAAGLFKKTSKPDPAEHVPVLIKTLKSEPDERKRATAAEELREFDSKTFPEIIPALIEALRNDGSVSVRSESVNSIGKLRPVTQVAGYALEQAAQNDPSIRVRLAAKTTLAQWTLFHGFRPGRPPESNATQTEEPPLALPLPATKMNSAPRNSSPTDGMNPPKKEPVPRSRLLFAPSPMKKPDSKSQSQPGADGPALNSPM